MAFGIAYLVVFIVYHVLKCYRDRRRKKRERIRVINAANPAFGGQRVERVEIRSGHPLMVGGV